MNKKKPPLGGGTENQNTTTRGREYNTPANPKAAFGSGKFRFRKELLPSPAEYFRAQGLKLSGGGEWKSARCPFHDDSNPSLRIRLDSGGFKCMSCGAHGGDIVDFHAQRWNLTFTAAARDLNAWDAS